MAPAATGVILTGGKSRRMGRDKLPLQVGPVPLLDRVHDALSSRCAEVLVAGGGDHAPAGARRVPDLRPGRQGPLAGIEAGLLAARHGRVFVAAGDMPFLAGGLVAYLLGLLSEGTPAVVPVLANGSHPLCAAYHAREVSPAVAAALDRGERSARGLVEGLRGVRYVGAEELRRFGDPDLLLANVNSPEDLARARAILAESASAEGAPGWR